jgi:malate dehydrogenase (oxaloacetate-decarboxylating)
VVKKRNERVREDITMSNPTKVKSDLKKIDTAIKYREKYRGLIGVKSKLPVKDSAALSSVYTPGVGEVCLEVQKDLVSSYDYTCRGNSIAIISDGSAVYGMGDLGPYAVLPALEAKSVFHKTFAGIDAYPIPINTKDVDEIVKVIKLLQPTFGAFHLEDIASPKCYEIENKLKEALEIPFLHVDQEGAGVAVLAAIMNACKLTNRNLTKTRVVIAGAGSAGISTAKLLSKAGIENVILCDSRGAIFEGRSEGMNWIKTEVSKITNPNKVQGSLSDVIKGADILVGLSKGGVLTSEMIASMAQDPIVLCLSLPQPEMMYADAIAAGAKIAATGRSDSPNQLSSAIAAPGIFRAVLDVRAEKITDDMLIAAACAMAGLIEEDELNTTNILPKVLDYRTAPAIARAVAEAATKAGLARKEVHPDYIEERTLQYIYEGENAWIGPPTDIETSDTATIGEKSIAMHKRHQGVIEIKSKVPIKDNYIYDALYAAPAATEPCKIISENKTKVYDLTCKNNMIAVVTDGTAVLGLGDIGATAGLPVMEGKCVLFKMLGGVEALPICVDTKDIDEIVWLVTMIEPVFGGINLEDIGAPRCFDIESKLKKTVDIPIFHDDQHGTAVVTLAGIINALKYTGKEKDKVKVVMNGAGAGSLAVAQLLLADGIKNIIICDTKGAIYKGRPEGMNPYKDKIADLTNLDKVKGSLEDVLKGTDVFIGLSKGNLVTEEMVKSMNTDPIIFALANPYPEIMPDKAYKAGAKLVATGRSDFPNQVNNSIAFPGIFRGTLDVRATEITDQMKVAAAYALANLIKPEDLSKNNIIPNGLDLKAPVAVAEAVARTAIETGIARLKVDPKKVRDNIQDYLYEFGELRSVLESI